MTKIIRQYELVTSVEFIYDPDVVDPFFYIEHDGARLWRMEGLYDITTEEGIWQHLAYNCIVNGIEDASRLDGWGDLQRNQLNMYIDYTSANLEEA